MVSRRANIERHQENKAELDRSYEGAIRESMERLFPKTDWLQALLKYSHFIRVSVIDGYSFIIPEGPSGVPGG